SAPRKFPIPAHVLNEVLAVSGRLSGRLPRRKQAVAARQESDLAGKLEPEVGGKLDFDAARLVSDRDLDAPGAAMPPMGRDRPPQRVLRILNDLDVVRTEVELRRAVGKVLRAKVESVVAEKNPAVLDPHGQCARLADE